MIPDDAIAQLKQWMSQSTPLFMHWRLGVNLPDTHKSRLGDELTAEKMKECVWLRPEAVAQIEFLEWTEADRLRHAKFGGLRGDKNPRTVVKEFRGELCSSSLACANFPEASRRDR